MKPKICRYCGAEIIKRDDDIIWAAKRPITWYEFMKHKAFGVNEHKPERKPKLKDGGK